MVQWGRENYYGINRVKTMVVDDNADMRVLICSLVSGVAQEVVECAGGEEAVARFAIERPDWTVMDVVMPGVDGLVATRRIKARFPDARIVVVTQHDDAVVRDLAFGAGATEFLNKGDLTRLEGILSGAAEPTTADLSKSSARKMT